MASVKYIKVIGGAFSTASSTTDDLSIKSITAATAVFNGGAANNGTVSIGPGSQTVLTATFAALSASNFEIKNWTGASVYKSLLYSNGTLVSIGGDPGSATPYYQLDLIDGGMRIRADGLYFGGTVLGDADVKLYRSAANTLKTDDNFIALSLDAGTGTVKGGAFTGATGNFNGGGASTGVVAIGPGSQSVITSTYIAATAYTFEIKNWSSGSVYKNVLFADSFGKISIGGAVGTIPYYDVDVAGSLRIQGTNALYFGDTASSPTASLYSIASDSLTTDGKFTCARLVLNDNVSATKGITFADGTRQATAVDGSLYVTLATAQTVTGQKTFQASSAAPSIVVTNTAAAADALIDGSVTTQSAQLRVKATTSNSCSAAVKLVNSTVDTASFQLETNAGSLGGATDDLVVSSLGASNKILFSTNNGVTQAPKVAILGDGTVGIGTLAPEAGTLVTIRKDQNTNTALFIQNNNETTAQARVDFGHDRSTRYGTFLYNNPTDQVQFATGSGTTGGLLIGTSTASNAHVRIRPGGTGRTVIGSDTATPNATLSIIGDGTNAGVLEVTNYGAATNTRLYLEHANPGGGAARNILEAAASRNTLASPATLIDGDIVFSIVADGHDGTAYQSKASIEFRVNGAVSAGVVPTDIYFMTSDTAAARSDRMRITANGNVSIGDSAPDFKLDVAGDIRIQSANKLYFGGSGAADNDVDLYRSAANVLKTDDDFEAKSLKMTAAGGGVLTFSDGTTQSTAATPYLTVTVAGGLTVAAKDPLYISAPERVYKADATDALYVVGFAVIGGTDEEEIPMQFTGFLYGVLSGATAGTPIYLSDTGGFTATAPSTSGYMIQRLGYAWSPTDLLINIGEPLMIP